MDQARQQLKDAENASETRQKMRRQQAFENIMSEYNAAVDAAIETAVRQIFTEEIRKELSNYIPEKLLGAEAKAEDTQNVANIRTMVASTVTTKMLNEWTTSGTVKENLRLFDEIDVPLKDGGTVTVVCAYVCDTGARFIFKDCWDEGEMDDEDVSERSYFESKGREHVLGDILLRIAPEWREIMTPRLLKEDVNNDRVEYLDKMWLPSATDMFGEDKSWWNDVDDSFQLPIFKRARCRVKGYGEYGEYGTCSYWLRSVRADYSMCFCFVRADGGPHGDIAYFSRGFAPGFDIGRVD